MNLTKTVQALFDKAQLPVIAKFSCSDEDSDAEISLAGNFQGEEVSYSIQVYEYGDGFGANFYSGAGDNWMMQCLGERKSVAAAANLIINHILKNKTLVVEN